MDTSKYRITYAISQNLLDYDVRESSESINEIRIAVRKRKFMDVVANLNMVNPIYIKFPKEVLVDINSLKPNEGGIAFHKIVDFIKINLENYASNDVNPFTLTITKSLYKEK